MTHCIIFGLFADYQYVESGGATNWRVASDKLYVFQHNLNWELEKGHFVARNAEDLRRRQLEEPTDTKFQEFCNHVTQIFDLHCHHDPRIPLPPTERVVPSPSRSPAAGDLGKQNEKSAAWPTSFRSVEAKNPLAADLLRVCAFYSSASISSLVVAEAFYACSLSLYDRWRALASRGTPESKGLYNRIHKLKDGHRFRDQAVHLLEEHGLLKCAESEQGIAISIPDSVSARVMADLDVTTQKYWIEYALKSINSILPPGESGSNLYSEVLPHTKSCLMHAERLRLTSLTAATLLAEYDDYFRKSNNLVELEYMHERVVKAAENIDPSDATVGVALIALAQTKFGLGQRAGVEELLLRAKQIFEMKGTHDFDHAICLQNLGVLYCALRENKKADQLFRTSLSMMETILGAGDLRLAEALEAYAMFLQQTSRTKDAKVLINRAKAIRDR